MPAFAAGESGVTWPTTGGLLWYAGISAPFINTPAVTTTARMRFISGPMMRIWKRSHLLFDRNSSSRPERGSSGFSPAIFT